MRARHGWAAAALAVAMLNAAPGEAQGRSCDGGRGAMMIDLGFRSPARSVRVENGQAGFSFDSEPRIRGVRENGPAAGLLREGDVLVAVDGRPITTPGGAQRYAAIQAGDVVRLSVRRGGRVQDATITAGERCIPHPPVPPEAPAPPVPPDAPLPPSDEIMPEGWMGFALRCQDCGDDALTGAFRFREPPVVVSVEPGSPAARAGVLPGDRLTHVDGVSLTSEAGWPRFSSIKPGQEVRLTFTRNGGTHQAALQAQRRSR